MMQMNDRCCSLKTSAAASAYLRPWGSRRAVSRQVAWSAWRYSTGGFGRRSRGAFRSTSSGSPF